MADNLASGERVEVRGFGSFQLREYKPRAARNPKTGESLNIGSQNLVHFKAGKPLRDKINTYFKQNT